MPDKQQSNFGELRNRVQTWKNRAAMARQAGNAELEAEALQRARDYENEIAKLQEFEDET